MKPKYKSAKGIEEFQIAMAITFKNPVQSIETNF